MPWRDIVVVQVMTVVILAVGAHASFTASCAKKMQRHDEMAMMKLGLRRKEYLFQEHLFDASYRETQKAHAQARDHILPWEAKEADQDLVDALDRLQQQGQGQSIARASPEASSAHVRLISYMPWVPACRYWRECTSASWHT